ncbi:MAG: hypothetical protein GEU73_05285 [Chloroflexi bacterium]|nr:hypothetical protein [Chloroflexota bacterium]
MSGWTFPLSTGRVGYHMGGPRRRAGGPACRSGGGVGGSALRAYGRAVSIILLLAFVASACAGPGDVRLSPMLEPAKSVTGQKAMTIGILEEPSGIGPFARPTSGGGAHQVELIAHRYLATLDSRSRPQPEVANELPSIEQGTWTVNPDGTMETLWRLRPNVRWHDGTPMVADDWVFGWEVDRDSRLPKANTVPIRHIESAVALDEHTLVLRWNRQYPFADALLQGHLDPLQRSRHEALFREDPEGFMSSPAWDVEFVGLGPYRLVEWSPGASVRFEAFDQFYRGKPRVQSIVVQFLSDPDTMLASIQDNAVDVSLPLGLPTESVLELQQGWGAAGTGNQVLVYPDGRLRFIEVQMRPEYQRPMELGDRRVREAIYRVVDRQQLVDVVLGGLGKPADSWLLPDDPARITTFQGVIPDYSHDDERAQLLLQEAGFQRGGDGVLVHQTNGERFETAVWNTRGTGHDEETGIVVDRLRSVGIQVEQSIIPPAKMSDREFRASFPGVNVSSSTVTLAFENNALRYRPPAQGRPLGSPRHGYSNPRMDELVDRLQVAIPADARAQLQSKIMQIALQDLPILPLYWDIETITAANGITGPQPRTGRHVNQPLATWNIYAWDRS